MLGRSGFSLQQKLLVCLILLAFTTTSVNGQQPTAVEQPNQAVNSSVEAVTDHARAEVLANTTEPVTTTGKAEKSHYFTVQYAQRYDDNVLLRSGDKSGELIYVPQVGFGVSKVDARNLIRIDYLGGAEIHNGYSEFSGALHTLTVDLRHRFSKRLTIFTSERYLQRPVTIGFGFLGQDLGPNSSATPTALTTLTPTKSIINDIGGGLSYRLDRVSTLDASYYYITSRYNNELLFDTNEQRLALDYARQVSRARTYGLAYTVSYFSGSGNLVAQSLIPSLRFGNTRLRWRVGAGPQWSNSSRAGNTLSWTALADVSYEQARTTYNVTYNSGTGTGGGFAAVTRNHTIFGSVAHEFNNRWSMENRVGFSYARNISAQLTSSVDGSALPTTALSTKELLFESRVNYLVGDRTSAFFSYLHSRQMAGGNDSGNVSRNLISLGISFDTRRTKRTRMQERF